MEKHFSKVSRGLLEALNIEADDLLVDQFFFSCKDTEYHADAACIASQDHIVLNTSLWEIYEDDSMAQCACFVRKAVKNKAHLPLGFLKKDEATAFTALLNTLKGSDTLEKARSNNFYLTPGLSMLAITQSVTSIMDILAQYNNKYLKLSTNPFEIKARQILRPYAQSPRFLTNEETQALYDACEKHKKSTVHKKSLLDALSINNQKQYALMVVQDAEMLTYNSINNRLSAENWAMNKNKKRLLLESVQAFAIVDNTEIGFDDYLIYAPLELAPLLDKKYYITLSDGQNESLSPEDMQLITALVKNQNSYLSSLDKEMLNNLVYAATHLK